MSLSITLRDCIQEALSKKITPKYRLAEDPTEQKYFAIQQTLDDMQKALVKISHTASVGFHGEFLDVDSLGQMNAEIFLHCLRLSSILHGNQASNALMQGLINV